MSALQANGAYQDQASQDAAAAAIKMYSSVPKVSTASIKQLELDMVRNPNVFSL
jgi:hypothetical protein